MKSNALFEEPAYAFVLRKYSEYLGASIALLALVVLDIYISLGGPVLRPETPYVVNAAALMAVTAIILIGHRKAPLRRYAAGDGIVRLPCSRAGSIPIPERLPLENLIALSLEPSPRRPDLPAFVRFTLSDGERETSHVTVAMSGRNFGVRNLEHLVLHVESKRIESLFGREWKEWVASRASP